MFEMVPVICNNISAIGYDDTENTLHIEFNNEEIYEYKDVELNIFAELLYSKSKSEYLEENIYGKYISKEVAEYSV